MADLCYTQLLSAIHPKGYTKDISLCYTTVILQRVMTMAPEILLAEDDEQIREAMTDFFPDKAADVLHLTTAANSADRIRDNHIKKLRYAPGNAGRLAHTVITKGYQLTDLQKGALT